MFQYRGIAILLFGAGCLALLMAPTEPGIQADKDTIQRVIWALGP
jgi:hypothetical protein